MKKKKYTTISIPKLLYKLIGKRIKNTGFTSVSSYVTYKLRQILIDETKEITNKDAKELLKRLRELGYV